MNWYQDTPMYLAIHLESWMATSVRPAPSSAGHVDIDWLRVWRWTAGAPRLAAAA